MVTAKSMGSTKSIWKTETGQARRVELQMQRVQLKLTLNGLTRVLSIRAFIEVSAFSTVD